MPNSHRRGLSLIEVIVAMALLGLVGLAWLTLAAQSVASLDRAHARERRLLAASTLLMRVSALPRAELESLAGRRRIGDFTLRVSASSVQRFELAVLDSLGAHMLLRTHVLRLPEGPRP